MRVVIQRVNRACVSVQKEVVGEIGQGLLVLAGFTEDDNEDDFSWMAKKICKLRIFDDLQGVMNNCLAEVNGELLIVSQFTLHAKTKKGNRPSYISAAPPEKAQRMYHSFLQIIEHEVGNPPKTGIFGAMMKVELENDGPVTIFIDSKNKE